MLVKPPAQGLAHGKGEPAAMRGDYRHQLLLVLPPERRHGDGQAQTSSQENGRPLTHSAHGHSYLLAGVRVYAGRLLQNSCHLRSGPQRSESNNICVVMMPDRGGRMRGQASVDDHREMINEGLQPVTRSPAGYNDHL